MSVQEGNKFFAEEKYDLALKAYQAALQKFAKLEHAPVSLISHCEHQIDYLAKELKVPLPKKTDTKMAAGAPMLPTKKIDINSKIAFFTDSRGGFKHDPKLNFFWENFSRTSKVDAFIQPYKWTSITDFLELVKDGLFVPSDYDWVVLWAGVVDFSPRPVDSCIQELLGGRDKNLVQVVPNRQSFYQRRINAKAPFLGKILPQRDMEQQVPHKYDVAYAGDYTASLYAPETAKTLARELNNIDNLIFIDTCHVHPSWDGNYEKGRPRNINEITTHNKALVSELTCPVVSISDWSDEQLREYTIDSLHLTQAGSNAIEQELTKYLQQPKPQRSAEKNFIVTASDSNFFSSALLLLTSLFEKSPDQVDGVLVFDTGLTAVQIELLNSIRNVHVTGYRPEDIAGLKKLPFDFFNKDTYGFKSYALAKAPELLEPFYGKNDNANVMYIDAGISIAANVREIFDEISQEGIFCVDHNDCHDLYGDQPFMLLNILSPQLYDGAGFELLSEEQLSKPYIKAGFFGYKINGAYQHLIDEHWRLCTTTRVLNLPKGGQGNDEKWWYRNNTDIAKYLAKNLDVKVQPERLFYSNGRQDQTALSYLIIKHNVKINNSRRYNFTVSTNLKQSDWDRIVERLFDKYPEIREDKAAFWDRMNGSDKRLTKASLLPAPPDAKSALTILHRGAAVQTDYIKNVGSLLNRSENIKDDIFILLGNGPSLGDVDLHSLKKHSTFGLNAAYRAYEKMNFSPKYFGCFDALVCGYHSDEFKRLIRESDIEKFFFINYNEKKEDIFTEPDILASEKFTNIKFRERTVAEKDMDDILSVCFDPFYDMVTSGTNSIQSALLMGYRKIILLGCDANYTEIVDGAKQETTNKNRIVMEKTPDQNPNYWFADYQQSGDRFNLPNLQGCQLPSWDRLHTTLSTLHINAEVINCSPISQIDVFKKMDLDAAIKYFESFNIK